MPQKNSPERRFLQQLRGSAVLQRPDYRLNQMRQKLDDFLTSLTTHSTHRLALSRGELGKLAGKLETLSPLKTLARGYAICCDDQGQVLREADQVGEGETVNVLLNRGRLLCTVEGRVLNGRAEV